MLSNIDQQKETNENNVIKNKQDEPEKENVNQDGQNKSIVEFSFGTFWNWFLPSCIDAWSSSSSSSNNSDIVIAYGAKSFLFLANIIMTDKRTSKTNSKWKFVYKDIVNVFDMKSKSQHSDAFRSNTCYITTVVFDKTFSMIKHCNSTSSSLKNNVTNCAMIFLGNSDGIGALYDYQRRITLLQNLPFSTISRSCCKNVTQKKILSACWLHFNNGEGPVVFYSLDTHIVMWKVKKNHVQILHDRQQNCSESRFNSANIQISCLASLPAECSGDKSEHRLAIGYMGGKIVIIGFDVFTGNQTETLIVFTENGHNDDICSLSFSPYSISAIQSYSKGLLCSVSRDSVLKIWSICNRNEMAEHRIILSHHSNANLKPNQITTTNWFVARFMPRSCVKQHNSNAYEIILTNSSGDLLTFTLPEKGSNSKLRIAKAQKSFQSRNVHKNQAINHTFIIFSIAMNFEHNVAITNSLDYKLILWNLVTRKSETVLYSFSNGALAIDCCRVDKRIAVAFGSNVFVLDFIRESNEMNYYDVDVQRLPLSSTAKTRFFNLIWNRNYHERLGRLIIGTNDGDLIYYDLNSKEVVCKSTKTATRDSSKIYSMIWLDTLLLNDNDDNDQKDHSFNTPVALTLHQSGKIMINHLTNNFVQENFEKYLTAVPVVDDQKIKHTAIVTNDDQRLLFIGNDDGTVDVFVRISSKTIAFKHSYRFRSFNRPCLSLSYCSSSNYLAVTALHENYINCYKIDNDFDDDFEFNVKNVPLKCRLQGHAERVSYTCWCPFNRNDSKTILLASASYDTTCIVWDIITHRPLKRFFGHKSLIYCIRWCHFDADYLFTSGEDNFFFWNWTKQSDYDCSQVTNETNIRINSLYSMLKKNGDNDGDDQSNKNMNPVVLNEKGESMIDSSIATLSSDIAKLKTTTTTKSTSIKALFPLSNQLDNNSTKYEHLDDIKWLILLKQKSSASIPPNKLDRILMYGQLEHIEKLLTMEIDYHKKNSNHEAECILELYRNATAFIEKQIAENRNECDPIMAIIASGISSNLYSKCIKIILGDSDHPAHRQQSQFQSKFKWSNYSKELSAIIRISCLNDFNFAIDLLLKQNLYREAIVISIMHLASEKFVNRLMYEWHKYRLKQNNTESAIKCLISAGYVSEALQLLKRRRILCSETSPNSILQQYDEIIELLSAKQ